jgi:hypothetical protein
MRPSPPCHAPGPPGRINAVRPADKGRLETPNPRTLDSPRRRTFFPKDQADYARERGALQWGCWGKKTGQLRCAKRKESPGSLNGILPGFAGPFTARALLPLAPAPPSVSGYDRERNVSFPSSRLRFPRCGVKRVCASVPSTAGVRFRIYLHIFCASPRVNPFGPEARDELGVRFGRQTGQLPALKRPRTRLEPRTASFSPSPDRQKARPWATGAPCRPL